jgi:hypothetical protein
VNLFNRLIVVFGLIVIMALSAVLLLATEPVLQWLVPWLQQLNMRLLNASGVNLLLRWGGGVVSTLAVWAICVALLWSEVRRTRPVTIKVFKTGGGGEAELTVDSITSRLENNINQLPEVIKVKTTVNGERKGVRVELELETNPEIDVPATTEQIQRLTKDIVENRMGLKLGVVRVVMHHAPYSKGYSFKRQKAAAGGPPEDAAPLMQREGAILPNLGSLPEAANRPEGNHEPEVTGLPEAGQPPDSYALPDQSSQADAKWDAPARPG